jgi:hypothetical protein
LAPICSAVFHLSNADINNDLVGEAEGHSQIPFSHTGLHNQGHRPGKLAVRFCPAKKRPLIVICQ